MIERGRQIDEERNRKREREEERQREKGVYSERKKYIREKDCKKGEKVTEGNIL